MKFNNSFINFLGLFVVLTSSSLECAEANQDTLAIGKEAQRFLDALNNTPSAYEEIASQPIESTYANSIVFGILIAKCQREHGRNCSITEVKNTTPPSAGELLAMIQKSSGKVQRLLMNALIFVRAVKPTNVRSVGIKTTFPSSTSVDNGPTLNRQSQTMMLGQSIPLDLLEILRDNGLLRTLLATPGLFLYPQGLALFGIMITAGGIIAAVHVAILAAIGAVVGGALYYEYYDELSQVESFSDYLHSTGDGAVGVGEYYWDLVTEGSIGDWFNDLRNAF